MQNQYTHPMTYRCIPNMICEIPVEGTELMPDIAIETFSGLLDHVNTALRAWQKALGVNGNLFESVALIGTVEKPVVQLRARAMGRMARELARFDPQWRKLPPQSTYGIKPLAPRVIADEEPIDFLPEESSKGKTSGLAAFHQLTRWAKTLGVWCKGMNKQALEKAIRDFENAKKEQRA